LIPPPLKPTGTLKESLYIITLMPGNGLRQRIGKRPRRRQKEKIYITPFFEKVLEI